MLPKTATRFAETSLALYAAEGTFSTRVENETEMEEVARAFELLGCVVIRQPFRASLKVTAPTAP